MPKITSSDIVAKSEFISTREGETVDRLFLSVGHDPLALTHSTAHWNGELKPESMYVVIPCTFDPNWESKFTLTILTDNAIKIKKLQEVKDLTLEVMQASSPDHPPNMELTVVSQGEWKGETAGGCINHWTWRNNPQFILTVKKDLIATITLKQGETETMPSVGFYVTKSNGTLHGVGFLLIS